MRSITSSLILIISMLFASMAMAQGGRTITLEQAHQLAIQHNPNMLNIEESIHQANLTIYEAWTILLPNVSATGSITRNQQETALQVPTQQVDAQGNPVMQKVVIQELWGKSVGYSINMPMFNARSIPLVMNAYDNYDSSKLTGQQRRNELLFAVTAAYYQVQATGESVEVAQQSLDNANEFLRLSKARLNVGQATRIDVLRAESDHMAAEKELANARDSETLAKTALAQLIGIESDFEIVLPDAVEPVNNDLSALTNRALRDRADLKAAHLSVEMAKRSHAEVWTRWIPSLDVTFNHTWNSAAGFSGDKDAWMLIFGARWPLLEGGRKIVQLYQTKSQTRMSENSVEDLRLNIKKEVEVNLLEVEKRERNIEYVQKQISVADETYRLVKRQYEIGMATSLDVMTASTTLKQLKLSGVIEKVQYDLAVLTLNKSVGQYYELAGTR